MSIIAILLKNNGKLFQNYEQFLLNEQHFNKLKKFLVSSDVSWILPIKCNLTLTQASIDNYVTSEENWLPEEIRKYKYIIDEQYEQIYNELGNLFKNTIEFCKLPFPTTEHEELEKLIDQLVNLNICKRPKVIAPIPNTTSIDNFKQHIKEEVEKHEPSILNIFKKYHSFKDGELNPVEYRNQISDMLFNSIGTMNKFPAISVKYAELASLLSLESYQNSQDLQEFIDDGLLDQVFTLDEFIRWYENPATLVLGLGIAETAIGVTMDIMSGGWSPIAHMLISEGKIFTALSYL